MDPASVHTEKLKKSLFLAFGIDSDIMMCSSKPLSVKQFVKNVQVGVSSSVMRHFVLAMKCCSVFTFSLRTYDNIYLLTGYPVRTEKYQARSHIVRTERSD